MITLAATTAEQRQADLPGVVGHPQPLGQETPDQKGQDDHGDEKQQDFDDGHRGEGLVAFCGRCRSTRASGRRWDRGGCCWLGR